MHVKATILLCEADMLCVTVLIVSQITQFKFAYTHMSVHELELFQLSDSTTDLC